MNPSESFPALVADLGHRLRRRSFLIGGIAFMTSASALLSGCSGPATHEAAGASLKRLLERLVPLILPKGTPLHPADLLHIRKALDAILADMDASVISDLETAATLFEFGAGLTAARMSRFSSLNPSDAIAVLDEWQNGASLQRGIATVFKKLVYLAYWRDPLTWPAVEFDGPVSVKWGLPSLGNAPLPVEVSDV